MTTRRILLLPNSNRCRYFTLVFIVLLVASVLNFRSTNNIRGFNNGSVNNSQRSAITAGSSNRGVDDNGNRHLFQEPIEKNDEETADTTSTNNTSTNINTTTKPSTPYFQSLQDVWTIWEPVVSDPKDWCRLVSANPSKHPGLIYVKLPKTASSTLAGINIRMARAVAQRLQQQTSPNLSDRGRLACSHTYMHGRKPLMWRTRDKHKKDHLLWTMIRDPMKRMVSQFYHFYVSREGVSPTVENFEKFRQTMLNFQWDYIADRDQQKGNFQVPSPQDVQQKILEPYDFIGVTERMDESLAVMSLLWNGTIELKDLIVLSAKSSGGYDDGRYKNRCFKIQKPDKNFLQAIAQTNSSSRHNYDIELHQIINRSLDRTIDWIGRTKVQEQVKRLQQLRAFAEEHCHQEAIFPCSANGTRQQLKSEKSCYWNDFGCGHSCVDKVLV